MVIHLNTRSNVKLWSFIHDEMTKICILDQKNLSSEVKGLTPWIFNFAICSTVSVGWLFFTVFFLSNNKLTELKILSGLPLCFWLFNCCSLEYADLHLTVLNFIGTILDFIGECCENLMRELSTEKRIESLGLWLSSLTILFGWTDIDFGWIDIDLPEIRVSLMG